MKDGNEVLNALSKIKKKEVFLLSVSGKMASGKDSVGEIITEDLRKKGYDIINVSFGELIRKEIESVVSGFKYEEKLSNATADEILTLINILNGESVYGRSPNARKALQYWGTDVRRKQNYNYWIQKMSEFIIDAANAGLSLNVTDSRFPNEVELIELLHGEVIRLNVSKEVQIKRIQSRDNMEVNEDALNHSSETALDNYKFKKTFNGEKDLEMLSIEIINYLTEEM